ncbi:matrix metalloproteinase-17 isoform X2 [Lepisosteus oculatus]|uniref:matrix metalloproteinase-17 isoform X2 n=1 Tax=Lepisosteus oculatus TaxID=7918 RepID=UPI000740128A|nr:PREDICTED: matrix metalloproteinase-17 isoform X3 [Lepisosteus oculatus]
MILVPVLWFLSETFAAPSLTAEQINMGVDWLSKFGYLPPPDSVTGQLQTKEALTEAIKAMQKFGGLEETGVLDEATLVLMKTPRCSLPDMSDAGMDSGRQKRAASSPTKWYKRHLSWRVRKFPKESHLLGHDTVRALMYYALKVWSDIAPLNFHEVAGSEADIQIDFTKADHDDGYPFDGPGGTVAHAFFPGDSYAAGDTHFDDDESWTFRSPDSHGMDLFAVAVHEFGHAIGLAHTSAKKSIMMPYYQGPVGDPLKYNLPYEDKVHIWQLYGVRDSVSHTARPDVSRTDDPPVLLDLPENRSTVPPAQDAPDRCNTHFDAVAQIRGEAFFFKGKYFWRLTREKHLVSLRPAQIHRFWRGLPLNLDSVDAVYERPSDHKIVFFKDATGGMMTIYGGWIWGTQRTLCYGKEFRHFSMTPCGGLTAPHTSSKGRSTGGYRAAIWRWKWGTPDPSARTGWHAERCSRTLQPRTATARRRAPRGSTTSVTRRTATRSAPAPRPPRPAAPSPGHASAGSSPSGRGPSRWC